MGLTQQRKTTNKTRSIVSIIAGGGNLKFGNKNGRLFVGMRNNSHLCILFIEHKKIQDTSYLYVLLTGSFALSVSDQTLGISNEDIQHEEKKNRKQTTKHTTHRCGSHSLLLRIDTFRMGFTYIYILCPKQYFAGVRRRRDTYYFKGYARAAIAKNELYGIV